MNPAPEGLISSLSAESARGIERIVADIRRDLEIRWREHALTPSKQQNVSDEVFVIMAANGDLDPLYQEIADMTYETPNCYYEVGYAHAKGTRVIFCARADHDPRRAGRQQSDPRIHFDLDSHRFSFWQPGEWSRLRKDLRHRIDQSLKRLAA